MESCLKVQLQGDLNEDNHNLEEGLLNESQNPKSSVDLFPKCQAFALCRGTQAEGTSSDPSSDIFFGAKKSTTLSPDMGFYNSLLSSTLLQDELVYFFIFWIGS